MCVRNAHAASAGIPKPGVYLLSAGCDNTLMRVCVPVMPLSHLPPAHDCLSAYVVIGTYPLNPSVYVM